MKKCKSCVNKERCQESGNLCTPHTSQFVPDDNSRQFFSRWWVGNDKYEYHFDTKNPHWNHTHSISIDGINYCPYCGDVMYFLETDDKKGYCCICDGARAEIEYERELDSMLKRHKYELTNLKKEWSEKLVFDVKKLFEIKQRNEKEKFDRRNSMRRSPWVPNHVMTLNDRPLKSIEDMLTVC